MYHLKHLNFWVSLKLCGEIKVKCVQSCVLPPLTALNLCLCSCNYSRRSLLFPQFATDYILPHKCVLMGANTHFCVTVVLKISTQSPAKI